MTLSSGNSSATLLEGLPCGRLVLKLATTPEELREVFKLRYQVFNEELGEGIPESVATGLDTDSFDAHCDHLMVLDHGTVVGTYRLLHGPRRPPQGFYSQTEFNFTKLALDPAVTVELGRGCIRADFRKQTTLMALFWGLHRYMLSRQARYLIGCGSLPLMSPDDAEATFQNIVTQGHFLADGGVEPLPANSFKGDASKGTANLPPLAHFYVEFGAKILSRPAFDPVFKCYDLFMFFDLQKLSQWGIELLKRFDRRLSSSSSA